jgi:hypothetical protein
VRVRCGWEKSGEECELLRNFGYKTVRSCYNGDEKAREWQKRPPFCLMHSLHKQPSSAAGLPLLRHVGTQCKLGVGDRDKMLVGAELPATYSHNGCKASGAEAALSANRSGTIQRTANPAKGAP